VIGEFLVCGTTTFVLFDTSATGSYVTSRFVNKLSLPTTTRSIPIITSSPLGDIRCTLLCKGVDVDIQGHKFIGDLAVLPSNNIYVILGMDWTTSHKGVSSTLPRLVSLVHPDGTRVTFQPMKSRVSYGPPWDHYLGGYQDRLLGGPLGLPGLRYTAPEGVEHKDYAGVVFG
jgi:hypothetical protein